MADEVSIPGHAILGQLGKGGMATVYLAREEGLMRLVALKVMDQRLSDIDTQYIKRFTREAQTAASLMHPNIVPVFQFGRTDDGRHWLTMGYLEGGNLGDKLKSGALPLDEALGITRQMASALIPAHERNIIHRDIKPDNILFQGESASLTDFGIAKLMDASTQLTDIGSPGTVRYMSPEQAQGTDLDQRSDIYSLGVVLYEMLTGHKPTSGTSLASIVYQIAHEAPPPLPAELAGLQPLMNALLAKDREERISSTTELVKIIAGIERNVARGVDIANLTDGIDLPTQSEPEEHGEDATVVVSPTSSGPAASLATSVTTTDLLRASIAGAVEDHGQVTRADRVMLEVQAKAAGLDELSLTQLINEVEKAPGDTLAELSLTMPMQPAAAADGSREASHTTEATGATGSRSRWPLLAGVGLVLVAAVGAGLWWFVFNPSGAGPAPATLTIETVPQDASITLVDAGQRYQPGLNVVSGSQVRVRVAAEGYLPVERELSIQAGANRFDISLAQAGPTAAELDLVMLSGAAFTMGSPQSESGRGIDEGPQRTVSVPPFALGRTEVTRAQFAAFVAATGYSTDAERNVGANGCYTFDATRQIGWRAGASWQQPGFDQGENHPVVCVSWNDASAYVKWLGEQSGRALRLPTEAELEFAIRSGTSTALPWQEPSRTCAQANVADASAQRLFSGQIGFGCNDAHVFTAPVASLAPNPLGLADISGNVSEWSADCYEDSYAGAPGDASARTGPACGRRVLRGGSFLSSPTFLRAAQRLADRPAARAYDIGFRVAADG